MTALTLHARRHRLAELRGWDCVYCGGTTVCATCLPPKESKALLQTQVASLDHVIPTDRGGKTNNRNLEIACARCNGLKGRLVLFPGAKLADIYPAKVLGKLHSLIGQRRNAKFLASHLTLEEVDQLRTIFALPSEEAEARNLIFPLTPEEWSKVLEAKTGRVSTPTRA